MRQSSTATSPRLGRVEWAAALVIGVSLTSVAVAWQLANPRACLTGEDATLWALAADAFWVDGFRLALMSQRQPLFVVLTALLGALSGDPVLAPGLAGAVSLGLTGALSWLGGCQLGGRLGGAAVVAGFVVHPAIASRGIFGNADLLACACFVSVASALVALRRQPTTGRAVVLGLTVALALLCKPSALLLLPALALLVPRQRTSLAALPVAAVGAGYMVYAALTFDTSLGLALRDAFGGATEGAERFRQLLVAEGFQQARLAAPGGLAWVWVNLQRIGSQLTQLLMLAPLAAWTALHRGRVALPAWALGATMLLAVPTMFQARHLLPFLLLLALGCAAGAAVRSPWRWAPLSLVFAHGLLSISQIWRCFDGQPALKCSLAEHQAGRWLRARGVAHTPGHVLVGRSPALQIESGIEEVVDPRLDVFWQEHHPLAGQLPDNVHHIYGLLERGRPGRLADPAFGEVIWKADGAVLLHRALGDDAMSQPGPRE